jgi:hypothetical protein
MTSRDPEKSGDHPQFPNTLNITSPQGVDYISPVQNHADDSYELYKSARDLEVDQAEAKRVLRKIDYRIIPILFFTYMLQYLDKNSINFSSVYGLQKGTNLKGQDYSWLGWSTFFFSFDRKLDTAYSNENQVQSSILVTWPPSSRPATSCSAYLWGSSSAS